MLSIPQAALFLYTTLQQKICLPEEGTENIIDTNTFDIVSILQHEEKNNSESQECNNSKPIHHDDTAQLQESLTPIPTDDEQSLNSSDWDTTDSDTDNTDNNGILVSPYLPDDYKSIKYNHIDNDEEDNEEFYDYEIINDTSMNWNNKHSVTKIKQLMKHLLQIASTNIGIREDELYLMFATPSPESIIQHLRFGLLSDLCLVNIDRFGRRSYFYEGEGNKGRHTAHHVFRGSNLPTHLNVLVQDGMDDLCAFMTDTPTETSSRYSRIVRYSKIVKQFVD
eukprot:291478_1